jgi:hypothetical protein
LGAATIARSLSANCEWGLKIARGLFHLKNYLNFVERLFAIVATSMIRIERAGHSGLGI